MPGSMITSTIRIVNARYRQMQPEARPGRSPRVALALQGNQHVGAECHMSRLPEFTHHPASLNGPVD